MKSIVILVPLILQVLMGTNSKSALEVMQLNDGQRFTNNEYSQITMMLMNKSGVVKERTLELRISKDKQNHISQLIKFNSPADIKGTGFLSIEQKENEDLQWLYLPAFKKIRRISSGMEKGSFASSEFTFEDLNREDVDEYKYELKGKKDVEGHSCYMIEATPFSKNKLQNSAYSKREICIREDNYVMVNAIFYDNKGLKVKELKASDIKKVLNSDQARAYKLEMTDLTSGRKTVLNYNNIQLECCNENEHFTERYLTKE